MQFAVVQTNGKRETENLSVTRSMSALSPLISKRSFVNPQSTVSHFYRGFSSKQALIELLNIALTYLSLPHYHSISDYEGSHLPFQVPTQTWLNSLMAGPLICHWFYPTASESQVFLVKRNKKYMTHVSEEGFGEVVLSPLHFSSKSSYLLNVKYTSPCK